MKIFNKELNILFSMESMALSGISSPLIVLIILQGSQIRKNAQLIQELPMSF